MSRRDAPGTAGDRAEPLAVWPGAAEQQAPKDQEPHGGTDPTEEVTQMTTTTQLSLTDPTPLPLLDTESVPTSAGHAAIDDDKALIALLRRKLREQDDAIHAFLDVLERTGKERQEAWDAMKAEWNEITRGWTPTVVEEFLDAYERTMPERLAAVQALLSALTMAFREAVLIDSEMTDEQRAYWLGKGE